LAGKQITLINCAGCPTLLFRVAALNVIKLTQFAAPNVTPTSMIGANPQSAAVPEQQLQPIPGSNEIPHTDWASWLSSTVGIPYTVRNCVCFDEQLMAVRQ
jgi:hypothetical protein